MAIKNIEKSLTAKQVQRIMNDGNDYYGKGTITDEAKAYYSNGRILIPSNFFTPDFIASKVFKNLELVIPKYDKKIYDREYKFSDKKFDENSSTWKGLFKDSNSNEIAIDLIQLKALMFIAGNKKIEEVTLIGSNLNSLVALFYTDAKIGIKDKHIIMPLKSY